MIELSIVVCCYNRQDLILYALESLYNQTLSKELYEVIVIDNNSTDKSFKIIEEYIKDKKYFRLYLEMNQGLSFSRNKGYKEASGKYVAYIDDDARANQDWAEKILYDFKNITPQPDVVGGKILPIFEGKPPNWILNDFENRSWGENKTFLSYKLAKFGFSGSNMIFRKEILEEYNGFSTNFGIVGGKLRMGEDTEFFFRITRKYKNIFYDPELAVYHWTPVRNYDVKYRKKRSYNGGISRCLMEKKDEIINVVFKSILGLFLPFLHYSRNLFAFKFFIKKANVKFLEELSYRIGYIITLFSFQNKK